jgi:phosphomethylpyrimidine synthase
MCGHDWCSVRISKEITDFYSGKDEAAQPAKKAMASPRRQRAGAESSRQRGVLTRKKSQARPQGEESGCHSDVVKDERKRSSCRSIRSRRMGCAQ